MLLDEQLVKKITELAIKELSKVNDGEKQVPIAISARHLHLTREHIDILFGKGYALVQKKALMGDQFAAEECVTIVSGKLRSIENVRIIGPARKYSQVEISKTDAFKLGVNATLRESGKIAGSSPITIVGPRGTVYLEEGCIIAKRHIHLTPNDAKAFDVHDGEVVSVNLKNERGGIFQNVICRVDPNFILEMHIDTDEANGMGVNCGDMGAIICSSEQ